MCERFVSYLPQVGDFLRVRRFPPQLTFHHHHQRLDMTLAVAEALRPQHSVSR